MCAEQTGAPHRANDRGLTSTLSISDRPGVSLSETRVSPNGHRRPLDGPVVADLHPRPRVAQLDAAHASRVIAGWCVGGYTAADPASPALAAIRRDTLADLLAMTGLTPAAPHWAAREPGR